MVTWPLDLPFVDGKKHNAAEHLDMQAAVNEIYTLADGTASTVTLILGDVTTLQGDVKTLQGDLSTVQGDVSAVQGDVATASATALRLLIGVSVVEPLSDNEVIAQHTFAYGADFAADFKGSVGYANVAPSTVPVTITVKNGGTTAGQLDWAVGVKTATFSTTKNAVQSFVLNDRMVISQSGVADPDFAEASFTLVGAQTA